MTPSVAHLGCCKNTDLIKWPLWYEREAAGGTELSSWRRNKITSIPFWFWSKTFWKIPWGTLQSTFCHAALGKVYFQECSFKYELRTWTIFTCARLWFWNQKAGLSKLLCNSGHLVSGPNLLSLHQVALPNMDLPGHITLTVGFCILLQWCALDFLAHC